MEAGVEATLEKCNDLKCTPPEKATQLCSFADQSSENLGGSKKSTVGTWKKKKNCTPPNWTKFELEKSVQWKKSTPPAREGHSIVHLWRAELEKELEKVNTGEQKGRLEKSARLQRRPLNCAALQSTVGKVRKKRGARWNSWTVREAIKNWNKKAGRLQSGPLNCRAVHSSQSEKGGYVKKMCTPPCDSIACTGCFF